MLKLEDLIPGGKSDKKTLEDLAKKYAYAGKTPPYPKEEMLKMYSYLREQLQNGIKVEREHVNSDEEAKEIAMDHLEEDKDYYIKLQKAGLADELKESKVGDLMISIGEVIEEMDRSHKKLEKLINKMGLKLNSPEMLNLKKVKSAIYDLKRIFSESYDFGTDRSSRKARAKKFVVEDVVDTLDDIATFKKYRNPVAYYDGPIYTDVPYDLMDKYGFTKKILQKIQDNTYEYGHHISFDDKKRLLTIYSPNN